MSALIRGVYSLTRTKRRRVLWCAWWTGEPTESPFRAPDAWNGGARSDDEARLEAERAAGMELTLIEGRWAGAWLRVRAGLPPFVVRGPKSASSTARAKERPIDPHATLGVTPGASADEVKAAFRRAALVHHPDHGGEAAAFILIKRAYDRLMRKRS